MQHTGRFVAAVTLTLALGTITAPRITVAEEQQAKPEWGVAQRMTMRRGGSIRAGYFFINNIDTVIRVDKKDGPLGTRIDASEDLGLRDSASVPRLWLTYRFSKRHQLGFSWYDLERSATTTLGRTINLGEKEFLLGATVESKLNTETFKLNYTYIFHSDNKVMMGISPGIHFTDLDIGIRTTSTPPPADNVEETARALAPLPVLGLRLAYSVTPKLAVFTSADLFFLEYKEFKGSFTDFYFFAEYRAFKHVGIGGGWNKLAFDIDLNTDDYVGEFDNIYRGWNLYLSFYF